MIPLSRGPFGERTVWSVIPEFQMNLSLKWVFGDSKWGGKKAKKKGDTFKCVALLVKID